MKKILANKKRWHGKRKRKTIKAIVIHYTGNKGDTAKNNCNYFQNPPSLTKKSSTGAHFFISSNGETIKSIPMNQIAYAVGGARQSAKGGRYYKRLTNENTVSIELCNAVNGYTDAQVRAIWKTATKTERPCRPRGKNSPNIPTNIRCFRWGTLTISAKLRISWRVRPKP